MKLTTAEKRRRRQRRAYWQGKIEKRVDALNEAYRVVLGVVWKGLVGTVKPEDWHPKGGARAHGMTAEEFEAAELVWEYLGPVLAVVDWKVQKAYSPELIRATLNQRVPLYDALSKGREEE